MLNQLNKNKNKLKEKDKIHAAQGNLILAQQAERRRRFQKIPDRHRSTEELLEETRQRVELVEEAKEEFLSLYSPREENPDRRESTRTARSAEGARAWSELFIYGTLPEREDPSSPKDTTVGDKTAGVGWQTVGVGEQTADVGKQIAGVGVQITSVGVQTAGVGVQIAGVGVQTVGVGVQITDVAGPSNTCYQNPVLMAGPKEKLPKFDGDGDPIQH